jgi:putative hydrolase of the HAD superfamily
MVMTLFASAAPKAVIFDFGGVIASSVRATIKAQLKKDLHLSDEEIVKLRQQQIVFSQSEGSEAIFWETIAKQKNISLPPSWASNWYSTIIKAVVVDKEMMQLVEELKHQQLCVGLLSNIDKEYAELLREYGYYQPFNPCILSCDIGIRKPDVRMYQALLDTLSLSPEDVIFIDDKADNIAAAKSRGFDTILFENAEKTLSLLKEKKAL